jgi:hypothetical protein
MKFSAGNMRFKKKRILVQDIVQKFVGKVKSGAGHLCISIPLSCPLQKRASPSWSRPKFKKDVFFISVGSGQLIKIKELSHLLDLCDPPFSIPLSLHHLVGGQLDHGPLRILKFFAVQNYSIHFTKVPICKIGTKR